MFSAEMERGTLISRHLRASASVAVLATARRVVDFMLLTGEGEDRSGVGGVRRVAQQIENRNQTIFGWRRDDRLIQRGCHEFIIPSRRQTSRVAVGRAVCLGWRCESSLGQPSALRPPSTGPLFTSRAPYCALISQRSCRRCRSAQDTLGYMALELTNSLASLRHPWLGLSARKADGGRVRVSAPPVLPLSMDQSKLRVTGVEIAIEIPIYSALSTWTRVSVGEPDLVAGLGAQLTSALMCDPRSCHN